MEKHIFLDYEIVNTGNGDGYVLTKNNLKAEKEQWQIHLGNYNDLDSTKRAAVLYFMLARPETFATCIWYRCIGLGGSYQEYFKFERCLKEEGIAMPSEITAGNGINNLIYFKDQGLGLPGPVLASTTRLAEDSFIKSVDDAYNTGGNILNDIITLKNGMIIQISEEGICLYKNEDDQENGNTILWYDEGTDKCWCRSCKKG